MVLIFEPVPVGELVEVAEEVVEVADHAGRETPTRA
jgi:hypothetical protein